jgi:hypothetical protein
MAVKAGTPNMRLCANLSRGESINKNWDINVSDVLYPPYRNPTIHDICELACVQRDRSNGEPLEGATLDVATAFNQVVNDGRLSLQNVTQVMAPKDPAHDRDGRKDFGLPLGERVWYLVISLVLQFGHIRASHIYGVFTKAIDWYHNRKSKTSCTYVDDGIMIGTASQIKSIMAEYLDVVVLLFGSKGSNENKRVLWGTVMVAIGWMIDLHYSTWRVQPKPKGMLKMVAALFVRIPHGTTTVKRDDLESVLGLLRWYCTGFRVGSAFLSTLTWALHAKCNVGRYLIPLGPEAVADLDFWRVLLAAAHLEPGLLSVSIDHLRVNVEVDIVCTSDASSSIGAGSWFRDISGRSGPVTESILRWSTAELQIIGKTDGAINLLEYFAAIHAIFVAGESLRGCVVHCDCDMHG